MHLRSRKTLTKDQPSIRLADLNEDVKNKEQEHEQSHEPLNSNHAHHELQNPPYLEILNLEKPPTHPEFDFLGELKNMCVKIQLFQAINYVPIY